MKQASWQVPKVNSFPPLQQLFKLKSLLLFALVHHHPLLPTIRKDNRLGKCSKGEGGGYKVATEGKPFFFFFFCSGCQPSSGRLRAPRAPHRFAPTGVFPPVIFRVHGPRLHHNGGHKAQITGPRVDCCFCFLPFVSDKIRSWRPLSRLFPLRRKCSSDRGGPGGAGEGVNKKMSDSFRGPGSTSKWTRLRQKTLAAEKCRFFSLPFLEEKKLSSRRFFPDILKNEL
jgi:hypothetical protein